MHAETQTGPSLRFAPGLTQLMAGAWAASGAFVYLFRHDGWLVPLQFVYLLGAALPSLAMGPYFAEFWLARLMDAVCVAAILTTSLAVGAVVIERLTPEKNLVTMLFSLGAGSWITSVSILLVGSASTAMLPWIFLLAGCWLLPAPRRFFHRVGSASEKLDGWTKAMLVCLIVAALLNLLGAMTPPFEYDELEYHLGAPAEYLKAGRIIALPHNFYSNLPQLTEMLYLLAMKMSSGVAAKLLHWSFGVLAAVTVYVIAARLWTRRIAVTAMALFYCLPFVQDLSETARIDLATTFFAALAFGALLLWMNSDTGRGRAESARHAKQNVAPTDDGWLWLSALATGAAVATKWTVIPVVLLPAVVFVVVVTKSVRRPLVFCFLSAAVVLPWLVKNWLLMGNPVYPLLNDVFQNPHWGAAQAALFARKHYASFGWDGWKQFVTLAWQYSFPPAYDSEGHPIGGEVSAAPLLLMTAPLVLLLRNAAPSSRRAGWLFVASYAGWFLLTFRPWRFLFPAFPLAAMTGAYAMHAMERGRLVGIAVRLAVGSALAVGLSEHAAVSFVDQQDYRQIPPRMNFVQYALGQVSREEFIERMGGGLFEPILWMNRHLPPSAQVLYIGEARTYYARQAVVWSTAFDQPPLELMLRQSVDAGGLFELMRLHHITHIYVNPVEQKRLRKSYGYMAGIDVAFLEKFLNDYAEIVHVSGPCAVYELKSPP